VKKRHRLSLYGIAVTCAMTAAYVAYQWLRPTDVVIVNAIGEPYEHVRLRSRSTLPPYDGEGGYLDLYVKRPAIFRFNDPRYGFVTPPAKLLFIGAVNQDSIDSVTLSPQVKALPLDASMRILIDLENQFRRGGWRPIAVSDNPPIEDTPATRAAIKRCDDPTTYWQAAEALQISLNIRCFPRDGHPDDDRYLMTLQLSTPFVYED